MRKCDHCGKLPAHQKVMCPACDTACFKCKKLGHFSTMCRSVKMVDAVVKNAEFDVAFLGEMNQGDQRPMNVIVILEEGYKSVGRVKL